MQVFAALVARGGVKAPDQVPGDVTLGPRGERLFAALRVDVEAARRERRRFATACLDWTERRPHLGGALGAALWAEVVSRGWIVRRSGSRAVVLTPAGARGLKRALGATVGR